MRMIATILLIFAVLAAAAATPPDADAPGSVLETLESIREVVGELAQTGADLLSFARDVLGWLGTGIGYLERLMNLAESGMGFVNETVERVASSP
ncbi:MAG: hypothetical protein PHX88_05630 [Methanoculleus horonobensis]|nr:hypothetical protein [Methanoculleus horonobensis]MDD4253288.1 hypothetical protein [Methanoculleus horonobensis]